MSWSKVVRDTIAIVSFTESDIRKEEFIKKGTYVQIDKKDPVIYLDLEGDGFLEFNPDDLEEVAIVPYCFFIQGQFPPNLEESKYYPQDFTGNPKDWFSSETVIIYQG